MKDKEKILGELKDAIEKLQKEYGLRADYETLNSIIRIENLALSNGYVPNDIEVSLSDRLKDLLSSWLNYFHNLLMPNSGHMVVLSESKLVDLKNREIMLNLMSKAMYYISQTSYLMVAPDKKEFVSLIDEAVLFWNEEFSVFLEDFMKKVKDHWKESGNKKKEKKEKDLSGWG